MYLHTWYILFKKRNPRTSAIKSKKTFYNKEILDDGYIRVGVKYDYKPFGFINNDGRLDGFDIDLIKTMMNKLDLRVQFIEVSSINKEKMLLDDKLDILFAGMVEDKESNKKGVYVPAISM